MRHHLTVLSCFLLALSLLVGCSRPESGLGLSVSEGTVSTSEVDCEIGQNPIHELKQCGLDPSERERALALLAAEKQAKLRQAKKKLGRPTDEELLWMARTMMGEASSEYGMQLVGNVILERKQESCWPASVKGVAREAWQFTAIHKNNRDLLSLRLGDYDNRKLPSPVLNKWRRSIRAAYGLLALPDSLRPPEAHGYANLSETHRRPWMDDWRHTYSQGEHRFWKRPGRCPEQASHNLASNKTR
jgi:hypothetical protein